MNNEIANLADRVRLRPAIFPDDESFLSLLYFSTRDDLNILPLAEEQKNLLLRMQYESQKRQYEQQFAGASHDIVLFDDKPVGRFLVMHYANEILAVDLSILPEYRNLGIGSLLLRNLLDEATDRGVSLGFHVEKINYAALRLYQRLGFSITEDTGTHFKMEQKKQETVADQ